MVLIDFIKANENWREILTEKPYCLNIKEKDNYALFKYQQGESDMSLPIVQVSRGIIIDLTNMSVACRRFDKFFNYQEPYAAHLIGKIRAEEKIDGSIIGLWYDRDGHWRVSTNGMIDAYEVDLPVQVNGIKTYGQLFEKIFNMTEEELNQYKEYTLIFELVSPQNRIVVEYPEDKLYFLGLRNNKTGQEISSHQAPAELTNHFELPRIYPINSIGQAAEVAKTLDKNQEGFVLVDELFNRVKVKGAEYLKLHILRSNTVSTKGLLELILAEEDDDLISNFPEYGEAILTLHSKIDNLIEDIENSISVAPFDLDKKDFAIKVKETPYAGILFKLYNNPGYEWKNELLCLDNLNKLYKMLGF